MKRLLFLPLIVCFAISSCSQQLKSVHRQEQDKNISNQLRLTPLRKLKLKTQTGNEYYAISKDTSGNFKAGFTIREQKRHYYFIYLHSKLVHAWVREDVADDKVKWKDGYYYFKDNNLIYKEEPEPNFVDIEEVKVLAEEYLQKAKTL